MNDYDENSQYNIKVRCGEKMKKGFNELIKLPNIPPELKTTLKKSKKNDQISCSLLRQIHEFCKMQKCIYFHELFEHSEIIIPKYEPPARNLELEMRIQRLKNEQLNKEYEKMTRNVSIGRHHESIKSFGQEVKSVQKMLITVFNFILTVAGSFAFAYKATEYALENRNVPIQLCSGLVVGTVVFFADLYFVMKHEMVEEGTITDSVYDYKQ